MEKFALLNLLKALDGLSRAGNSAETADKTRSDQEQQPDASVPPASDNSGSRRETPVRPNVMAGVLERHEAMANRIKNKK